MMKKPNYLTFGMTVSGLNVDEPKFSSLRTLRVELKERQCDICWFKLCSSKLTITSLTRNDLSAISTRTLYWSSPRTFGFQNGAVGDWAVALQPGSSPAGEAVVPSPPIWNLCLPISCLVHRLLHASNIVFKNVAPSCSFGPTAGNSWRRAWL